MPKLSITSDELAQLQKFHAEGEIPCGNDCITERLLPDELQEIAEESGNTTLGDIPESWISSLIDEVQYLRRVVSALLPTVHD